MSMSVRTLACGPGGRAGAQGRSRAVAFRRRSTDDGVTARAARTAPVGMLTHSYYEEDPRVRREAETLVAAAGRSRCSRCGGPAIRSPASWPASGSIGWTSSATRARACGRTSREYLAFFARAGWAATRAHRRSRFALLQVHTAAGFPRLRRAASSRLAGVPLVLDLHEAMPEFFRMRFPRASNPIWSSARCGSRNGWRSGRPMRRSPSTTRSPTRLVGAGRPTRQGHRRR